MSETATSTRKSLSKKAQHTRKCILDAAMAILEEKGIGNLTIARVVKRACVSNGSYLHQFETKEDLLAALIEFHHQKKTEALETKFDGFSIRSRMDIDRFLVGLQDIQIGYFCNVSNEFFVSQRTNPALRPHIKRIADRNRERSHRLYLTIFGDIYDRNPRIAAIVDDYVNVVLRGIAVIAPNRSPAAIETKIGNWTKMFAVALAEELDFD